MRIPLGFIPVKNMEPLHLSGWILLIINCIVYIIFLRGLFFLRKIAREFLLNKTLTKIVVNSMKITGNQFTLAGLISLIIILTEKLFDLHIETIPKSFSITPFFLIIVGLFFTIQSQTLLKAIKIKDENDLMV
ncbi:MAG: hypothetical protein JXR36_09290 [Bacteroidales bacterium]|nr:hypothetical protein [Bacteroidales bacterium]